MTSGRARIGRAASALRIDQFFGACSPITMCSDVLIPSATAKLIAYMSFSGIFPRRRIGISNDATAGSVTAPSPRLARVTPSWQLDRYRSSRCLIRSARRCKNPLDSASSRDCRAPTAANSDATKYPLSPTSASVARILQTVFTAGGCTEPVSNRQRMTHFPTAALRGHSHPFDRINHPRNSLRFPLHSGTIPVAAAIFFAGIYRQVFTCFHPVVIRLASVAQSGFLSKRSIGARCCRPPSRSTSSIRTIPMPNTTPSCKICSMPPEGNGRRI